MRTFGEDLIQSLGEALAHGQGKGPAILHSPPAIYPEELEKEKAEADKNGAGGPLSELAPVPPYSIAFRRTPGDPRGARLAIAVPVAQAVDDRTIRPVIAFAGVDEISELVMQ